MARTIRDTSLDTRAARERLTPRGKPYYRKIEEGLHLGYRKPRGRRGKPAVSGKWVLRHYVRAARCYEVATIGVADDFSDADGVAVLNFKQAQDAARARMVQRAHDAAGVARGPLTVRAAIASYVEFLEAHGKTAADVRHRAAAYIDPVLGDVEIVALTAELLRKWHLALAKAPARLRTERGQPQQYRDLDPGNAEALRQRRASANRILTMLKAALNRAFHDGKIPSDAAWRRVKPFKGVERARVRFLTLAEAKRLINACDHEFRPLVQAALASGCRYGELCRMQVQDFNPDAGTVAIHTSKSGKSRHVILTAEGCALFAQLAAGRSGAEPLLRRTTGDAFGKSHQGRPMAEACRRAKLKPTISFHGLRHTWASHAVMNGVPLLVVAKNLGHRDTKMCELHYAHLAPSYEVDQIRKGAPQFGFKPGNVARLG
jgi:integrase